MRLQFLKRRGYLRSGQRSCTTVQPKSTSANSRSRMQIDLCRFQAELCPQPQGGIVHVKFTDSGYIVEGGIDHIKEFVEALRLSDARFASAKDLKGLFQCFPLEPALVRVPLASTVHGQGRALDRCPYAGLASEPCQFIFRPRPNLSDVGPNDCFQIHVSTVRVSCFPSAERLNVRLLRKCSFVTPA